MLFINSVASTFENFTAQSSGISSNWRIDLHIHGIIAFSATKKVTISLSWSQSEA